MKAGELKPGQRFKDDEGDYCVCRNVEVEDGRVYGWYCTRGGGWSTCADWWSFARFVDTDFSSFPADMPKEAQTLVNEFENNTSLDKLAKNAFDEYQDFTCTTAIYPEEKALEYLLLGCVRWGCIHLQLCGIGVLTDIR